jgi:hypothetical protein
MFSPHVYILELRVTVDITICLGIHEIGCPLLVCELAEGEEVIDRLFNCLDVNVLAKAAKLEWLGKLRAAFGFIARTHWRGIVEDLL